MKIDSTHQLLAPLKGPGCESCQSATTGSHVEKLSIQNTHENSGDKIKAERHDRVTLSASSQTGRGEAIYRMSELKKIADEALAVSDESGESVSSISDDFGDIDREERVAIATLRVSSGFYEREDVLEELARRLSGRVG